MEKVAKACGSELSELAYLAFSASAVLTHPSLNADTFQRCILANQKDPSACDEYRASLSRCASDAVPLVSAIKRRCEPALKAYDACLAAHTHEGDEALAKACTPALGELWRCTEAVKKEEADKIAKKGQQAPV